MNLVECVETFDMGSVNFNYKMATCLIFLEDSRLKFEEFIDFDGFVNNFGMSMMLAMKLVDPTWGLRWFKTF